MSEEVKLDEEGRLLVPPGLLAAMGWLPGQTVTVNVEGNRLVAQASVAPAAPTIKDEARRLAAAMRDLTSEAARQVTEAVNTSADALKRSASSPVSAVNTPQNPALHPFHGTLPWMGERVYVAPGATLIGDVSVGADASIWPGAVLRGDVAPVRVGPRTNVQEGAVLHVSPQQPCLVGAHVTIGHQATVHACTVGDHCLIGIHAVVLDGAVIGERCIIAAGTVVTPGTQIPPGKMVMGVPGKVVRDLTPEELERVHWNADSYVSLKNQYQDPTHATPPAPVRGALPTSEPPKAGTLPRYECRRAPGPITVDGSLDDPGWNGIPPLSPLVHAHNGERPVETTEVRACWDDECLYVSFSCKDADIWGNFEHRDDPLYDEEVVELFLCPSGDLRHYFELEVSPLNVLFDATVFNPELDRRTMLVDRTWDAPGIRTAVRVSGTLNDHRSPDIGWIAEVALPFRDLGLEGPPTPGTLWRVNFYRIERGAATEFTAWSPTYKDPPDFHVPQSFGEFVFVE